MARYIKDTSKASICLTVEYKCSKCGNHVTAEHLVKESASKKTEVTEHSMETSDMVREESKKLLKEKVKKIFEEGEKDKYDTAQFNIKCPHCNHKEPWSKLRITPLGCLVNLISILLALTTLLLMTSGDWDAVWPCLGCSVGGFATYALLSSICTKKRYKQIASLPKESLPEIHIVANK